MNMVRKALNLMLVRQQFGLPIILLILFNNNLITTENKKFLNFSAEELSHLVPGQVIINDKIN